MSCNGCRVLRKGCSESCVLRPCLDWIETPEAQGNATLFVSKFFGRSDLISFISAVPFHKRPALFQSLLFEACGRTVNPVNGVVGLLSIGNWHACQAAVQTVLAGGNLSPLPLGILTPETDESFEASGAWTNASLAVQMPIMKMMTTGSFASDVVSDISKEMGEEEEPKLLNLFV